MLKSIAAVVVTMGFVFAGSMAPRATAQHDMKMGDVEFAHLMAKHHQGGIEMAELEEKAGASAGAKALAAKIRKGQQSELPKLQAHAKGQKLSPMVGQHEKEMQKEHMATMAKLKSAKGAALDRAFAEEMIKHHQSALQMISETEFKNSELEALADTMAANQKREIQELQKIK